MKLRITGLIVALVISATALAETKKFPMFDGELTWLRFDYPARFVMNPESFQGEAKWRAKFNDPDSALALEVSAFGYVANLDLLLTIPGITIENYREKLRDGVPIEELIAAKAKYKNIGDYFRVEILPKDSEETKFPEYERFVYKKQDRVVVYFLDSAAYRQTFGRCYQTLTFTFPEGSYEKHQKDIEAIIQSTKPPYQKTSKQDGADQLVTAPESKREDAKKSFLNGVARLKERQTAVFNEETLPALKPIKDVQITSEFLKVAATQPLKGVVRVRIRVTEDSGHVKLFWFSHQEGKWIVTGCTSEPWSSKHPPKVSIGAGENEPFVGKVQACFK